MRTLLFLCGLSLAACSSSPEEPDGTGGAGGGGGPSWACTAADVPGVPATPTAPWFVDVSGPSGVGAPLTTGFGRATLVDLDGDGRDDVVATPTHDGPHAIPEDDFAKLVLRNRGDGTFEDFTGASGLRDARLGLMVFADVDSDGDADMFGGIIEGEGIDDRGIWLNDGTGKLALAHALEAQVEPCGERTCRPAEITATFFDADGDGNLDLYVGQWSWSDGETSTRYNPPPKDLFFEGNGDGTFDARGLPAHPPPNGTVSDRFGRAAMGVAPGDFDGDGDVDLFVSNYGAGRPSLRLQDRITCEPPRYWNDHLLWRNDGRRFAEIAVEAGVAATMRGPEGITEEPPLVIGEECPESVRGEYPSPIGGNGFTAQFADYDNDGDLDLVVGTIAHADYVQSDPTVLFVNQGPPDFRFVDRKEELGLRWREDEKHPVIADLDADGLQDLVITGFRNPADNSLDVYRQRPDHTFERLELDVTGIDDRAQESLLLLDFDGDGDLDVYVGEEEEPARLFENVAADGNRVLAIRLVGDRPRDATGARVTLDSSAGRQLREVTSGHGHYNPQLSRTLTFGLGGDACAVGVTVRWPDGSVQELGDVAANQLLVVEKDGTVTAAPLSR